MSTTIAGLRLHISPRAGGRFDLEGCDGPCKEEGQTAEVSMAARVEVLEVCVFFLHAGPVDHVAEVAVVVARVAVAVEEGVFGEFEDDGD